MHLRFVVCLAVGLLAGCGKNSPTEPTTRPDVTFSGTWTGTMSLHMDSLGHGTTYSASFVFDQTGSALTGTWSYKLRNAESWTQDTLVGTVDGDVVVLVLNREGCSAGTYGTRAGSALTIEGFGFHGGWQCGGGPIAANLTRQ